MNPETINKKIRTGWWIKYTVREFLPKNINAVANLLSNFRAAVLLTIYFPKYMPSIRAPSHGIKGK